MPLTEFHVLTGDNNYSPRSGRKYPKCLFPCLLSLLIITYVAHLVVFCWRVNDNPTWYNTVSLVLVMIEVSLLLTTILVLRSDQRPASLLQQEDENDTIEI